MTVVLAAIVIQGEFKTLERAVIDDPYGFRNKSLLLWIKTHQALVVLEEEHPIITLDDLCVHLVPIPHELDQLKSVERLWYLRVSSPEDCALIHGPPSMVLISQDTVIEVPKLQVYDNFDLGIREDFESVKHLLKTSFDSF